MRRSPQRERPTAGGRSDDDFGCVPHHDPNREKQLSGDWRGDPREERVAVGRGAFAVGMAMQNHVQAGDVVMVRRSAAVMVVCGQVEGHRPTDRRRRGQGEQRGHGQGSLQGTPHGGQYPRCVAARQNEGMLVGLRRLSRWASRKAKRRATRCRLVGPSCLVYFFRRPTFSQRHAVEALRAHISRRAGPGNTVSHAELHLGSGVVMRPG